MEKELLIEVAQNIINKEIFLNWKFYIVVILLIILVEIISSFVKSYFTKRGEHLATKADLKEIVHQQKIITETTESIKKEVEHGIWKKQEFSLLRRQKLEQLLTLVYEQGEWLEREARHHLFDGKENTKGEPINQIIMICNLYFPELIEFISSFKLNVINLSDGFIVQKVFST